MSTQPLRRPLTTVGRRWNSSQSHYHELPHKIRALLRDTAQPVAVVTSFMPAPDPAAPDASTHPRFHGATLSSFTSISLAPHPLVAFSLRVPSRMATTLSALAAQPPSPAPSSSTSDPHTPAYAQAHMVINILSAAQVHTARVFARPERYPRPFDAGALRWRETREGLPVLHGSIGALSCRVVGAAWPLGDLDTLARGGEPEEGEQPPWVVDGVASELFIARVVRVEEVLGPDSVTEDTLLQTLPLLYHKRNYTTVLPAPIAPPEEGDS